VFDLDGTLVDSVPIIIRMFLETMQAFDLPAPEYRTIEMQVRLGLLIDEMFRAVPIAEQRIPTFVEEYRRRYRAVGIPATRAYPEAAN
jgi:phosphoglycolate phosphatase-like HAD superfamily hydrolase